MHNWSTIYFIMLVALSFAKLGLQLSSDTVVELPSGKIRGQILTTPNGTDYYAFQGIPYAAPPVGNRRFEPPIDIDGWNDILNTTSDRAICHQVMTTSANAALEQSEDCLHLSVYIPKTNQTFSGRIPVMFWIFGGGFSVGSYSNSVFGPAYFMDYGVIIVTFNYRLGAFGFLSTGDLVLPGNAGLKDQLFALKWVKKNIHLFGGDPAKITIFGQSSGAASVSYLLNTKKSDGLFRGAILESGTTLNPWSYVRNPLKYAYKTAEYANSSANFSDFNSMRLVEYLKSVSASELLAASKLVFSERTSEVLVSILQAFCYGPTIEPDHADAIVTESMYQTITTGGASRVPIIMGFNSEEAIGQAADIDRLTPILQTWDKNVSLLVPDSMNVTSQIKRAIVGFHIQRFYCKESNFSNTAAGGVRYISDQSMIRPVIKHAMLQSFYSDVYFYKFSYDGALGMNDVVLEGAESVGHSEEINYLWQKPNLDLNLYPASDVLTHNRLLSLWTNFAKYLNPTPDNLSTIIWPKLRNGYLNIGSNLTQESFPPRKEAFTIWEYLFAVFGNPPYFNY